MKLWIKWFRDNFEKFEVLKERKVEDFFCKDCGNFLLVDKTLEQLKVIYIDGKNNKVENMYSSFGVIKPRTIAENPFYRVRCFDCYKKKFGKEANKTGISYDIATFLYEAPLELLIKYKEEQAPKLENFIRKYGEVEGKERFKARSEKIRYCNSEQYYIDKHGEEEGKKKWEKKQNHNSYRQSLEGLIEKFGEIEGREIWEERKEDNSFRQSLEGYIEKYGEVEGKERFKARSEMFKHVRSVEGFIERHGEEDGEKKREEWIAKVKISGTNSRIHYSIKSQELFDILQNRLVDREFLYGKKKYWLRSSESSKMYYYDFADLSSKKIIEFNGDFWHANPILYNSDTLISYPGKGKILAEEIWKLDEDKISFAKSKGFDVLVIWEADFNKYKKKTIQKCLEFLKEK